MEQATSPLSFFFISITILSLIFFYFSIQKNNYIIAGIVVVALIQAFLGVNGFFLKTDAIPPRIMFLLLPAVLFMSFAFFTEKGKHFTEGINLTSYTYLHTIRIGVELAIFSLFTLKLMPESMTFEGRNFDILSGLTAPFIAYFGFQQQKINKKYILWWNIICLLLVLQVVITGILSVPSPFQKLSFEQPNTAVLCFPYLWLPGIIVPIVIFGHLVAIKKLLN